MNRKVYLPPEIEEIKNPQFTCILCNSTGLDDYDESSIFNEDFI